MKSTTKVLFIAVAFVLLAAGCGKQYTEDNNAQVSGRPTPVQENDAQPGSNPKVAPGTLTITQTVEGSSLNRSFYTYSEGQTALEVLKSTHKITTQKFGDIGEFVENIDGVKPDAKHFWAFYVNGKSSNIGAGSYKLKNSDTVEWKLEEIK